MPKEVIFPSSGLAELKHELCNMVETFDCVEGILQCESYRTVLNFQLFTIWQITLEFFLYFYIFTFTYLNFDLDTLGSIKVKNCRNWAIIWSCFENIKINFVYQYLASHYNVCSMFLSIKPADVLVQILAHPRNK